MSDKKRRRDHDNPCYNEIINEDKSSLPLNNLVLAEEIICQQKETIKDYRKKNSKLLEENFSLQEKIKSREKKFTVINSAWIALQSEIDCMQFLFSPIKNTLECTSNINLDESRTLSSVVLNNLSKLYFTDDFKNEDEDDDQSEDIKLKKFELDKLISWTSSTAKKLSSTFKYCCDKIIDQQPFGESADILRDFPKLYEIALERIEELKVQCAQYKDKNTSSEAQIKSIEEKFGSLQIECDRLSKQRNFLRYKLTNQKTSDIPEEAPKAVSPQNETEPITQQHTSEAEIETLIQEKVDLMNEIDSIKVASIFKEEHVLQSSAYKYLQIQCETLSKQMSEKENEIETLRIEIINEISKKDTAFEKLLNDTTEQKAELFTKISKMKETCFSLETEKDNLINEKAILINELSSIKKSHEQFSALLTEKDNYLQKFKSQCELLKTSNNDILTKCETLSQENYKLSESLKNFELMCCDFQQQMKSTTPEMKNDKSDDGADKTEFFNFRKHSLEIENEDLKRKLANYEQLQSDLEIMREKFSQVSDEVEEVSRAFEEKLSENEKLTKQLIQKEELVVDKMNLEYSLQNFKSQLQKYHNLFDKKTFGLKQKNKILSKLVSGYTEMVLHCFARASLSEKLYNKVVGNFLESKFQCCSLAKEKLMLSSGIEKLKKLNTSLEEENKKKNKLNAVTIFEQNKLLNEKLELEKDFNSLKSKTDGNFPGSQSDYTILQQENIELRRRIICTLCSEHFKDHIITRCGHLFCRECLDRNIKARNRKCSKCNVHFDQKDIRRVFLD